MVHLPYVNKVAIVTGGASGIGLGIAVHLVKSGCKVVIADINLEGGNRAVAALNEGQSSLLAAFHVTDVTSWTSQVALFAFAYATFGPRIDFVFGNAGIAQSREMRPNDPTHFASADIDDLSTLAEHKPDLSVIEVDLIGVLHSLYLSLVYFRKQEKDGDGWRGKFVATGSNASFYPFPCDALYGTAKHGVLGAVRAVGPRVVKEGITVNALGPSVVWTPLIPAGFAELLEKEKRITYMSTVTNACDVFLAPGSKVTGQIIESCGEKNVFRAIPGHMDDKVKANMDLFWPVEETEAALAVAGVELEVVS
ncbi:hypothetical protein P7C70_g4399, partial [Phenoliferia sp. Uapishka_3]